VTVRQLWKASAWVPKFLLIALVLVGPYVFLVASDLLSADWIIWVGAAVLGALHALIKVRNNPWQFSWQAQVGEADAAAQSRIGGRSGRA